MDGFECCPIFVWWLDPFRNALDIQPGVDVAHISSSAHSFEIHHSSVDIVATCTRSGTKQLFGGKHSRCKVRSEILFITDIIILAKWPANTSTTSIGATQQQKQCTLLLSVFVSLGQSMIGWLKNEIIGEAMRSKKVLSLNIGCGQVSARGVCAKRVWFGGKKKKSCTRLQMELSTRSSV